MPTSGRYSIRAAQATTPTAKSTPSAAAARICGGPKTPFIYVWKEVQGDVALTADIAFPAGPRPAPEGLPGDPPGRLDAGAAYADAALHGDGLTSLQFRHTVGRHHAGGPGERLRPCPAPPGEACGAYVRLFFGEAGGESSFLRRGHAAGSDRSRSYIGLAVCSHDKDVTETARFSNVVLDGPLLPDGQPTLYSTLETQVIASTDRRVCLTTPTHIEAPNWLPDGSALVVNSGGRMYQVPAAGGDLEPIDTGFAVRCNNDHGLSPDGTRLVISDQSQEGGQSLIYILPLGGGTPERVTPTGPSYWHGWSPDGATLAFCGQRDGKFGIFTIPAAGGEETRLTTAAGLDDGPEYSPDGRFIYFNSDRTGRMQVWRMTPDGGAVEQVTADGYNNWFAHPSPDGQHLVFLSYAGDVGGHPPNRDVTLRLLPLDGDGNFQAENITVLARLFGGQGTINVPCWSADSKKIAFVTYQFIA